MATPQHLLIIDSSGFAYRAYHGGSKFPRYRESDGMPTGAILGFLEILHRLLGDASADPVSHVAAVFDPPGKTFRHLIFPAYKGNRAERDAELSVQLPVMRDAARALGIAAVEWPGYEADDVIATLTTMGVAAGLRVTIVSSDKDMGQLVRDGQVEIVDPLANKRVLAAQVEAKFGVPPRLVPDVQALAGDAVDNIPGVDGVGPGMAAKLVRKLGSLDKVMAEAAKSSGYRMTAGVRLAIRKGDLKLYLQLTTLRRDVPISCTLRDLEAQPMERRHMEELLRALEAGKQFRRMFEPKSAMPFEPSPKHPHPLDWHAKALSEYKKKLKSPSYRITLAAPDTPQSGWYKRKLIKDGPWVPARIWREAAIDFQTDKPSKTIENIFCTVGDAAKNPVDQWGWLLNAPISESDYNHMMKLRAWVMKHAPHEPQANPEKAIDWNRVPLA